MLRSGAEVGWRDRRCRSLFHCWIGAVAGVCFGGGVGVGGDCGYDDGLEMKAWLDNCSVEMEAFLLFLFESPIRDDDDAFAQALGRALVEDFAPGHDHRQLFRA